ncbi:Rossmann-like domain-containing protein [Saccharopolyspora griseoalba]|uniref:Rossmann-like domain-containing protein n=1 Tax=Saccharopolyspora griseoalba TaxID=1431848 RepID=A0ABW2LQZ3_9PSEU
MSAPRSIEELIEQVRGGQHGASIAEASASVGFLTQQGVRHASRRSSYRNHVLSLRVEEAVGSCAVEPGELDEDAVLDCVGTPVRELLGHPLRAVRVAALDAYLQSVRPHHRDAEEVTVGRGTSLQKSLHRAKLVVDLLPAARRVLVIGVVNSLLHHLRERGTGYLACDYKGGETEWGEPVRTDALAALDDCDAVLASGMVLGNGTFQPLLEHARSTGKPLVLFAQTGSGILPRFLGAGVSAVSAEPYPFFWLDGGPSPLYRYPGEVPE